MKWSKDKCQEIANIFESRGDFEKNYRGAYMSARNNNWLDEICSHMQLKIKNNYWTKERCQEESLKYNSRKNLCNNNSTVYNKILKNKWFYMFCHMVKNTDNDKRCIYAYEFTDNSVYIGLTKNIKTRNNQHIKKGSVYQHIKINNNYKIIQLSNYLDVETASKKEGEFVEKYKNDGWIILNKIKTGGIGSNGNKQRTLYWTKERCKEESLKYHIRSQFQTNSQSAYRSAQKNKWLDDICSHMKLLRKPKNYWTKERCKIEASKYKNKNQFQKNICGAYMKSYICGWLNEFYKTN
jgi:predicted GIY-YIG superfamily endonuclease